jgi:hypothetical protein
LKPAPRKNAIPGVNVMITTYYRFFVPIFCEKMAFLLKTKVKTQFLYKLAVCLNKNRQNFANFFGESI